MENFTNRINILNRIVFLILISSCIPSFMPEKKTIIQIEIEERTKFKWISLVGILDQNFPDFVISEQENVIDTICRSTNITEMYFYDSTLTIQFSGDPKLYFETIKIPTNSFNYKVVVDTMGLAKEKY
jgi:hypothetical protein